MTHSAPLFPRIGSGARGFRGKLGRGTWAKAPTGLDCLRSERARVCEKKADFPPPAAPAPRSFAYDVGLALTKEKLGKLSAGRRRWRIVNDSRVAERSARVAAP